jgi:cyclohexyl-isocyanide hydratase
MATRRAFVTTAAAAAILARPELLTAADPKPIAEIPADKAIRVGIIMFPRMDQIDLTGPFAVLSRLPNASVKLMWKTTDPIRDYRGLGLVPDTKLADAGPIDLLVVPGGPGQEDLMEDEAVLSFITKHAETAACVFSVCTGALICGAAGLLKGKRATTHWASVQFLKYFGATFVDERVVADGNLVSAAGLTAGIDGALRVAAALRGEAAPR